MHVFPPGFWAILAYPFFNRLHFPRSQKTNWNNFIKPNMHSALF